MGVAVQIYVPRLAEICRLPTPAKGDEVKFASMRSVGESAGLPFGSPATISAGKSLPPAIADKTQRDSSCSHSSWRARRSSFRLPITQHPEKEVTSPARV